jgi:ABC-type multidrug transport system fused ATPase/permease subunit
MELVKIILLLNNENFNEINFTKINAPINRISAVIFQVLNNLISFLLPNISLLFIVLLYFFYINFYIGLIFLIGNILIIVYIIYNWNNMMKYNKDYENHTIENESDLVEILNNIDKIIFRGQTKKEIENFNDKSNKTIEKSYYFYSNITKNIFVMNIIVFITVIILIIYLIELYFKKSLDSTLFITFFTILLLYRDRTISVFQQLPDYIEFIGRSESVIDTFNSMDDEYLSTINKKYNKYNLEFNNIEINNVNFKYKNSNNYIFENLNLKINLNNKIIGIVGLSGKGKSTFVKLIIKLYKFKGEILIDNININNISGDYIRENIVYINQNLKLFDKIVIENLFYGNKINNESYSLINEIMKFQKIKELFKNINITEKKAGLNGENLSGGQRQIINIISGLISDSKIIILDEPTNALDIELKNDVIEMIKYFKKYKKCIIIISHDKDIYPIFSETIKL